MVVWLINAIALSAATPAGQPLRELPRASLSRSPEPATREPLWREVPPGQPAIPNFVPPTSLSPLIRAVSPGVVNISSEEGQSEVTPDLESSLGSGLIIAPEGYVLTNNHVVERGKKIRVKLADGREFVAEVVGRDASTDIALLKIKDNAGGGLPFVYLGDSDKLRVGDWVVAIGNPFGLDQSVSQGIISAKERVIGMGVFDDFLQTDAVINPGNSGGPLFNMRGEVVGVNTAVVSQGHGIGFAVPINMVKDLLPNLRVNGHLARGWMGVSIQEHASETDASHKDAVITDIFKGSPAARAGLQPGDRVLRVNNHPVESYLELLRRIAILAPGSQVRLSIVRGKARREISVKVGERPAPDAAQTGPGSSASERLGLLLRELSDELAPTLGVPAFSGVLVSGIVPATAAEAAGIKPGDVINEVNLKKVKDMQSFKLALQAVAPNQDVLVQYRRGDSNRYVALRAGANR